MSRAMYSQLTAVHSFEWRCKDCTLDNPFMPSVESTRLSVERAVQPVTRPTVASVAVQCEESIQDGSALDLTPEEAATDVLQQDMEDDLLQSQICMLMNPRIPLYPIMMYPCHCMGHPWVSKHLL